LEVYHPVDQLDPMEKEEAVRLFKAWRGAVKHHTWINSLNHTWRPTLDEQIKARGDIMRTRAEWDAYRRPLEERVWQTRKSRRIEKGWLIGGWAAE